MTLHKSFLTVMVLAITSQLAVSQSFQKFQAQLVTKNFHNGKTLTSTGEVAYTGAGKMITHLRSPQEGYTINTAKGEVSIYTPKTKEVYTLQNTQYSTENSQLYFFLQNKKNDLGLKNMGFTLKNTRYDKDLVITQWQPPIQASNVLKEVELVHQGYLPIYMSYTDAKSRIVKKMYFYNYTNISGVDFPQAITQIDYPFAGDSIVSKNAYSDLKINAQATSGLFDFTVPRNAKVIKSAKK
ncbi:LolA family protein [Flexibacter flexilis]|nr:hypothetical protein [Flexibacter flexilis]